MRPGGALANPAVPAITPGTYPSRPAKGHAVAADKATGRTIRPNKETQNAQTEDEVERQKALPLHRVRQDQVRTDAQAPRHDQTLQRADPQLTRHPRAQRYRNP